MILRSSRLLCLRCHFFFSSRRRHTISDRDWSSDVCSSDLAGGTTITVRLKDSFGNPLTSGGNAVTLATTLGTLSSVTDAGDGTYTASLTSTASGTEIGRASCRGKRVDLGGRRIIKKKKQIT